MADVVGTNGVDRWTRVVQTLGIPTVFACALLWFLLTRFSSALDHVVVEMQAQTKVLTDIQNEIIQRDRRVFNYEWQHKSTEQPHEPPPKAAE